MRETPEFPGSESWSRRENKCFKYVVSLTGSTGNTHTAAAAEGVCVCLSLSRVVVVVPEGRLTGGMTGGLPAVRTQRKSWRWSIFAAKQRESDGLVVGWRGSDGAATRGEVFEWSGGKCSPRREASLKLNGVRNVERKWSLLFSFYGVKVGSSSRKSKVPVS